MALRATCSAKVAAKAPAKAPLAHRVALAGVASAASMLMASGAAFADVRH